MAMHRSSSGRGRSSNVGVIVIGTAVLLAAGGVGAWYFLKDKGVAPKLNAETPKEPVAEAPKETPKEAPKEAAKPAPEAPKTAEAAKPATPEAPKPAPAGPAAGSSAAPYVPVAAPANLTPQTGHLQEEIAQGVALIEAGKAVEGRAVLSEVLFNYDKDLKPENAAWIRAKLTELNNTYAYGKRNLTGDDITVIHTVKSGDLVAKIANKYRIPDNLLLKISGLPSAKALQVGQKVKAILGPIHARVVKHEYRMDLYVLNAQGAKIYLKSLPVGLGANDKTPVGKFRIGVLEGDLLRGKMEKPTWTDPEDGKHYEGGAQDNPIGKFWIPLQGTEPATANFTGYGIHGTIDPTSIGQNKSHGCVRLVDADIEEVYHTLFCGKSVFSTLEILP